MKKKVVKKVAKKKKSFGSRSFGGGGREVTTLRPRHVEKKPPCTDTCPSGNRIREFLTTISLAEGLGKSMEQAFTEAWEIYTDTSPFPAVCGRVCPAPCETGCNRNELEGAVGINKVERAIGDFGIENGLGLKRLTDEPRTEKVAVVGGGPSGFSCAYQLARRGYGVTVFEATDAPGGMLRWGIPGYRLPEEVLDAEIRNILDLGVELRTGVKIGRDTTLDELRDEYDAVYLALGAQQGVTLGLEGEDAPNVFSGVDFLNRFHHGEQLDLGKDVVVTIVGGGDTAIDAARICKRLGANVTVLYRRTRKEMPAIDEEVDEAIKEGVKIEFLAAPVGFRTEDGLVVAMTAIRMELGEPDESGRRRPVPIEGSEFEIPASAVISAVSQAPDFAGFEELIEGKSWITVDEYGATKLPGVWAGGDVTNLDIMTTAVGHGRRAAEAIERSFLGTEPEENGRKVIGPDGMMLDHYERMERQEPAALPVEERLGSLDVEVNMGLSRDAAILESKRCMSCGQCFYCEKCWLYCSDQAIEKPMEKGALFAFKLQNCTGCKKCAEICPCGFIEMRGEGSGPMDVPRILVAGLRGGGGKTLVAAGLAAAWRRSGRTVAPFKKGPDYIDTAWLSLAAGSTCRNLDPFLMPANVILGAFRRRASRADVAIVEGNRGLFDGSDARGTYSTAELAKLLDTPVLLVLDCTKATRTAAALVLGCQRLDPGVALGGVVLNRIAGRRHEAVVRAAIEETCGVPVLGALPRLDPAPFPERHLGLVPPDEHGDLSAAVGEAGRAVERNLDLAAILEVARGARPFEAPMPGPRGDAPSAKPGPARIGVFRDAAFQFYYPDNLEALEREGATLVPISPLADARLPAVDALYAGGGFPESFASGLAANDSFRESVRTAVSHGLPVYAECGGTVYLGERLTLDGTSYPMAGAIPGSYGFGERPDGHGYTVLETVEPNPFFPVGTSLRGHEFHYTFLERGSAGDAAFAFRLRKGHGFGGERDGMVHRNVLASYTHLHALGTPGWATALVHAAARRRGEAARDVGARPGPGRVAPEPTSRDPEPVGGPC